MNFFTKLFLCKRHSSLFREPVKEVLQTLDVFAKNFSRPFGFSNSLWNSLGYDTDDMLSDLWLTLLHPEDRDRIMESYNNLLQGRTRLFNEEYRLRAKDGTYRVIQGKGRVVSWDNEGRPEWYVGKDSDITEIKHAQNNLILAKREAEQRLQEAETLRTAGTIITSSLDTERAVELILQQTALVLPYDIACVLGTSGNRLELLGVHSRRNSQRPSPKGFKVTKDLPHYRILSLKEPMVKASLSQPLPEIDSLPGMGQGSWMGIPLVFQGESIGLLSIYAESKNSYNDDDLRKASAFAGHVAIALNNARLHEEIRKMAMVDPLTELNTRRWFFDHGEKLLRSASRHHRPLCLLMMDIDHFKRINDSYGHLKGDQILRKMAEKTKQCFRDSDLLCRYGGEEFVVLMPETTAAEANSAALRLQQEIKEISISHNSEHLTVSIGITECSHSSNEKERTGGSVTLESLIKEADKNLYQAKMKGRNCVIAPELCKSS